MSLVFVVALLTTVTAMASATDLSGARRVLRVGPDPKQAHSMVVFFTNLCNETMNLTSAAMVTGGFRHRPPQSVFNADSGKFNFGFDAEADPGSDIINGTVSYTTDLWGLSTAFVAVRGEWVFETGFYDWAPVTVHSADVGHTAVYNVVIRAANSSLGCRRA